MNRSMDVKAKRSQVERVALGKAEAGKLCYLLLASKASQRALGELLMVAGCPVTKIKPSKRRTPSTRSYEGDRLAPAALKAWDDTNWRIVIAE